MRITVGLLWIFLMVCVAVSICLALYICAITALYRAQRDWERFHEELGPLSIYWDPEAGRVRVPPFFEE